MQNQLISNESEVSSACSEGGSLLWFTASRLPITGIVSPILEKTALELENPYFRPFQYHNFNYQSAHNTVLFGIDLGHHTQYLEYKGTKVPSILSLLLEDIEARGGDGVDAYVRFSILFQRLILTPTIDCSTLWPNAGKSMHFQDCLAMLSG